MFLHSNSPQTDMSLHLNTLSWLRANQSLLILLNTACLLRSRKYKFYSLRSESTGDRPRDINRTRGEHAILCTMEVECWSIFDSVVNVSNTLCHCFPLKQSHYIYRLATEDLCSEILTSQQKKHTKIFLKYIFMLKPKQLFIIIYVNVFVKRVYPPKTNNNIIFRYGKIQESKFSVPWSSLRWSN